MYNISITLVHHLHASNSSKTVDLRRHILTYKL